MATNDFIIRCKTQNGSFIINDLNNESTLHDLKICISKVEGLKVENVKILCGYPPRALAKGIDSSKLKDVGIHSGETIYVEKYNDIVPPVPSSSDVPSVPVVGPHGDTAVSSTRSDEQTTGDEFPAFKNIYAGDYTRPPGPPGIMMRFVVPSNNSCLFTSVYYLFTGGILNAEKSDGLRKLIARIVSSNPQKYNTAFLGMSNEDYCAWIKSTDHWGGAIELAMLSEHFNLEIVAVDTLNLTMHRFGENCHYKNRIFLIYDGIHYDPLMMEMENGSMQTVFPVDDNVPMDMAMEIAREANSSRQYTDMANFTLRCLECEERMKGDKEARQHAAVSGHTQFGEINQ